MSTAAELIEEAAATGASLHVDDGRLVARGARLPEALLGRCAPPRARWSPS